MQNYTPLSVPPSSSAPLNEKKKSLTSRGKIVLFSTLVLMVGVVAGYTLLSGRLSLSSKATSVPWSVTCGSDGYSYFTADMPQETYYSYGEVIKVITGADIVEGNLIGRTPIKVKVIKAGKLGLGFIWHLTDGSQTDERDGYYDIAPVPNCNPSASPTPKPSNTPTPKPSATPTPKPSSTPTTTPKPTNTPTPTVTPKPSPTVTPKPSSTPTTTPKPSVTPSPTACSVPASVTNVKIKCPICSGS